MSFTDVGQVLGLQGGSPILKSGTVHSENLPVSKNVDGSTPGSMIPQLTQSGLGSIMQNPVAAITNQVQSALSGFVSQLTANGSTSTASAVTSLSNSVGAVSTAASYLAGLVNPPAGSYGYMDLMTHANTAGMLGPTPPTALALDAAAAPLTSGPVLQTAQTSAGNVVAAVLAGAMADATGASMVAAVQTSTDAVVSGSNAAISGLRAALPTLAAAASIGGGIAAARAPHASSADQAWDALLALIVQPDAYAALETAALAQSYVAPPVLESPLAPNLQRWNVSIRWMAPVPVTDGETVVEVI